jgi:hypothetical protein
MPRFTVSLAVVIVLLVGGITTLSRSTTAQVATPATMSTADHPIVGAWRWNNAPEDPNPYTYAIVHDDGTSHEVAGQDTGTGAWQATGERTAEIGYLFQDIDPFSAGFEPGTAMVRATMEGNEAGDSATATYSAEARVPMARWLPSSTDSKAPSPASPWSRWHSRGHPWPPRPRRRHPC